MHTQPTAALPKGAQVRIACRYWLMDRSADLGTVRIDSWGRYEFTTRHGIGAEGFLNATVESDDGPYGVKVVLNNGYQDYALTLDPKTVLPVEMAVAA